MASYRVFENPAVNNEARALGDGILVIRDGFSVLALIFPALWLLWRRLWLAFAIYLVVIGCLILLSNHINPILSVLLNGLFGLYLAFEAQNWRAFKWRLAGWREVDVVCAGDDNEALARAIAARHGQRPTPATPSAPDEEPKRPVRPSIRGPRKPVRTRPVIGGLS